MTSQLSSDEGQTPKRSGGRWALLVATFFNAGYARWAPGTYASFLTILLWVLPIYLGVPWYYRVLSALLIFVIGVIASQRALVAFEGQTDPSAIVIDEVAGQTLALAFCPPHLRYILFAFVLFRFFDILKPWPISWIDRNMKGGLGIMLDDMVAGLAAGLLICILNAL